MLIKEKMMIEDIHDFSRRYMKKHGLVSLSKKETVRLYEESKETQEVKIEKLFEGDPRLQSLTDAIKELIYERGVGLPVPAIIGVIEMVKLEILDEAKES